MVSAKCLTGSPLRIPEMSYFHFGLPENSHKKQNLSFLPLVKCVTSADEWEKEKADNQS